MAHAYITRSVINIIVAVVLFGTCVHGVQNQDAFGPSIASLTSIYRTKRPTNDDVPYELLSSSEPVTINLGRQPRYSVFVSLVTGKVSGFAEDVLQERGYIGIRSFKIQAPSGYGIIAVIQALDLGVGQLQLDPDSQTKSAENHDRCKNYVKFNDGEGLDSGEICGRLLKNDVKLHPSGLIGPRTFVSPTGKMTVSFNFGELADFLRYNYQTLLRRKSNIDIEMGLDQGPMYELAISFTSFRECQPSQPDQFIPCAIINNENRSCISASLFCDGIANCGTQDGEFGQDEKDCTATESDLNSNELPKSLTHWTLSPEEEGGHNSNPLIFNPIRDSNISYDPSLDRILQYNLSPASTILLIVITVVCIMILGIIIRFCCRRCVGTPLPIPSPLTLVPSTGLSLGSITMLRDMQVDIQMSPHQCVRRNYELDLPPSYDDLFPESKDNSPAVLDISASEATEISGGSDLVKVPEVS